MKQIEMKVDRFDVSSREPAFFCNTVTFSAEIWVGLKDGMGIVVQCVVDDMKI